MTRRDPQLDAAPADERVDGLETLHVRLLGTPSWTTAAGELPIPDPRAAVLIAMVALDGPLPRTQAAERFWPHSEGAARTNLRVLLHRLQHAAGVRVFAPGDRLALLPHVQVDVVGDEGLFVERCLQLGASNLRLLQGIEFSDLPEASGWLATARQQMEQRALRALANWLEARHAHEDLNRAETIAELLIAMNPLSEPGYRALMRVLVERGDRAGALAVFERCRRLLDEQLGTPPDRQTTALHREILRLRHDDADPADASRRRPLLQREVELAEIASALASRRVVIVEGANGTGKSALLSQFARERGDLYWAMQPSDGHAPLAGMLRLTHHLHLIAQRAGYDDLSTAEAIETLTRLQALDPGVITAVQLPSLVRGTVRVAEVLHRAGHRALVIDDVHLLDDSSIDVLAQVLVASRELLPWCDFVLAYRPMRARRKVRALCEKLAMDGRLRLIQPSGLRREAVLQLMEQAGTDSADTDRISRAERLVAMSGGTPGVLVELVESSVPTDIVNGTMPPQIRSILLERLRACSSAAEGLAQLASVAGASFTVALAATITGLSSWKVAEKWNELLLAGVFDARGFAFPLVEAAVRDAVPDAVRQFMHGEVARALERQGNASGRLAFHWREAGDAAKASAHGRSAAALCLQAGDTDRAIAALEDAVLDPHRRTVAVDAHPPAVLQLAALSLEVGRLDTAHEVLDAVLRAPVNPTERGVGLALLGRLRLARGDLVGARDTLVAASVLLAHDMRLHRDAARWSRLADRLSGAAAEPGDAVASPETAWHADRLAVHTPVDGRRCHAALRDGPDTARRAS